MTKLAKKQQDFTMAVGLLIVFAYSLGYHLTFGRAYEEGNPEGLHPKSLHKLRLAVDFNLKINGEWIKDGSHPAFKQLHDYWDLIGGAKRIKGDMNHFSFAYKGMR